MKALHVCSTCEVLSDLLPVLALIVANQLHQHQIFIFRPLTFAGIATVRAKLQRSLGIQWVIHLSSFVLELWGLRCLFSGLRTVHRRPVDRAHSGDRIQPTLSVAGYSHTHQPLCNRRCQRTGSSAELGQAARIRPQSCNAVGFFPLSVFFDGWHTITQPNRLNPNLTRGPWCGGLWCVINTAAGESFWALWQFQLFFDLCFRLFHP